MRPELPLGTLAEDVGSSTNSTVDGAPFLHEVANLCEMPQVYLCYFNYPRLAVNEDTEVETLKLVTGEILHIHQKCFHVSYPGDSAPDIPPCFLAVADGIKTDPEVVRRGFSSVVRARIEDGQFLIEEDKKTSLEELAQGLDQIAFHPKLGSLKDKCKRVEKVALLLHRLWELKEISQEQVKRAVLLCKADQLSQVVQEYPKLQGRIGSLYAQRDQEDGVVARAIETHYLPRTAGESLPPSTLGALLSVAERWESLLSLYAIGEKPSGRGDPLGMRRMAMGIWRLQVEKGWRLGVGKEYHKKVDEIYDAVGLGDTGRSDTVGHLIEALTTFQNQQYPLKIGSPWPLVQAQRFSEMMKGTCPASFWGYYQVLRKYEEKYRDQAVTLTYLKNRVRYWLDSTESWVNITLTQGSEKEEQGLHLALSKAIQVILSCGVNASSDVNNGWVDNSLRLSDKDFGVMPLSDVMNRVFKGTGYALASPAGYIKTILDAVVELVGPVDAMLNNVRIEDSSLDPEVSANRKALMGAVAEFIERTVGLVPMGLSADD